jgi:hypothetical protein
MRTRNLSFELEKTLPATFLLQGWLGGILAGFVYTVALCLEKQRFKLTEAVIYCAYLVIVGSVIGVVKATILWAP